MRPSSIEGHEKAREIAEALYSKAIHDDDGSEETIAGCTDMILEFVSAVRESALQEVASMVDGVANTRQHAEDRIDTILRESARVLAQRIRALLTALTSAPVCGWAIEPREGGGWLARHPEDSSVSAYLKDRVLVVHDDETYYPSGFYEIPVAVIEALQTRKPQ